MKKTFPQATQMKKFKRRIKRNGWKGVFAVFLICYLSKKVRQASSCIIRITKITTTQLKIDSILFVYYQITYINSMPCNVQKHGCSPRMFSSCFCLKNALLLIWMKYCHRFIYEGDETVYFSKCNKGLSCTLCIFQFTHLNVMSGRFSIHDGIGPWKPPPSVSIWLLYFINIIRRPKN